MSRLKKKKKKYEEAILFAYIRADLIFTAGI